MKEQRRILNLARLNLGRTNLKRKKFSEYKRMKKTDLINSMRGLVANNGRLRKNYADLQVENAYLRRRTNLLQKYISYVKDKIGMRTFVSLKQYRKQEVKKMLSVEKIEKEIIKLDPKLDKKEESFKVAKILLSAIQVGANSKKVAEFLGIKKREVQKYEKNLRDSKIWVGEKTQCDWFDKKEGGIAFWLDVTVALGLVKRTFK